MNYDGAQNAVVATEQRKGVLAELERSSKALNELRKRLNGLNVSIGGPKPEDGNKAPHSITPRHLEAQVSEIGELIQQCHDALSSAERSLGT